MKCDYCLEEVQDAASVCPHCTREQGWSISARRRRMLGCIGGPILAVVGAFLLLMLVGWIGSQREKVERQRQMAEDFCPKLAAAGWFGSTDECVASGDKAAIGFYMTTAGDKCRIETPATTTYPEDVDTCIEKRLKADKARGFSMWIASQSS